MAGARVNVIVSADMTLFDVETEKTGFAIASIIIDTIKKLMVFFIFINLIKILFVYNIVRNFKNFTVLIIFRNNFIKNPAFALKT